VRYTDPTGHDVGCSAADPECADSNGLTQKSKSDIEAALRKSSQRTNIHKTANTISTEKDNKGSAFLWGFNISASTPGVYHTAGMEEALFPSMERATYSYGGEGSSLGAGASGTAYAGIAFNATNAEEYKGLSSSFGVTYSFSNVGVTLGYFWNPDNPPFYPDNLQGIIVGYSPGAQASVWYANTVFEMTWSSSR
jgi:hypothetical protein